MMHLFKILPVAAVLSFQFSSVIALPVEESDTTTVHDLQKRATGTAQDPHILTIDCAGVEEVCEAQCLARLCFGVPTVQEYAPEKKETNFQQSGAKVAFKGSNEQRDRRGVIMRPSHPDWTSAEETIRETAEQGGWGTPLVPVSIRQNTMEGARYGGQLSSVGVRPHQFFKQSYTGLSSKTPYCRALMKNPPDTSICGQKKDKDDPMNFIQVKTTTKKGNNYRYRKLRYGIDTWGGFKSGGFVKRDYLEDGFDTQEEYEAALNEELN